MPDSFFRKRVSDMEYRLRLLCCIEEMEPISPDQLWPFVAQLELMDYVSMCLYLDELRQSGALAQGDHALAGMLFLTGEGRRQLELFRTRMPMSERERIRREAPGYQQALKERQYLRVMWEPVGEGRHGLLCTVQENETPTLLMRVLTTNHQVAEKIAASFREQASRLLLMLYTRGLMLSVEQSEALHSPAPALPCQPTGEAALAAATQEQAYLCPYGLKEQLAAICLGSGETQLRLGLLLPGQHEARQWAHAAMNDPDLYDDVLTLLTAEAEP
ncbi:MAG: DUF4364 family protein [Clostridiales bacterium]|nr:DUF4364 family protein [Clostridiales bacterium]